MKSNRNAAARTVAMFAGTTFGEEQENRAPPILNAEETVYRIALITGEKGTVRYAPAQHYRRGGEMRTLCGRSFAQGGLEDSGSDLGVCQACRAAASSSRAVVSR